MYRKKWSKQVCLEEETRALKVRGMEAGACVSAISHVSARVEYHDLPFYFSLAEELNRRLELR